MASLLSLLGYQFHMPGEIELTLMKNLIFCDACWLSVYEAMKMELTKKIRQ
jgi:hypothetical protein